MIALFLLLVFVVFVIWCGIGNEKSKEVYVDRIKAMQNEEFTQKVNEGVRTYVYLQNSKYYKVKQ